MFCTRALSKGTYRFQIKFSAQFSATASLLWGCRYNVRRELSLLPSVEREMSTSQSAVMLCGWRVEAGAAHSTCGYACGWQVKLCDPSLTRTIPERFRDEFLDGKALYRSAVTLQCFGSLSVSPSVTAVYYVETAEFIIRQLTLEYSSRTAAFS